MPKTGKGTETGWKTTPGTQTKVPVESVKIIAETLGIDAITDSAAHALREEVTHGVKQIVQDGLKFMEMGNKKTLSSQDINMALKVRNAEPVHGYGVGETIERHIMKWRSCEENVGDKSVADAGPSSDSAEEEVDANDENVIDIAEFLNQPIPPLPADVSINAQWLAIDGVKVVEPEVEENPSTSTS